MHATHQHNTRQRTHANTVTHTQKDGWLTGNSPTITVEMWDKWSVGEDTAPSPAALDTQRQVLTPYSRHRHPNLP